MLIFLSSKKEKGSPHAKAQRAQRKHNRTQMNPRTNSTPRTGKRRGQARASKRHRYTLMLKTRKKRKRGSPPRREGRKENYNAGKKQKNLATDLHGKARIREMIHLRKAGTQEIRLSPFQSTLSAGLLGGNLQY